MTFSSDDDIEYIARGLINCALPKAEWTHAAHFAAAVWMLTHPDYDAFGDMPDIIRRYNEATGVMNSDTDGYHETITLASLRAARHVLNTGVPNASLCESVNHLLRSEFGRSDWILTYWSKDVLFSIKARRTWVDPDRQVLPFD